MCARNNELMNYYRIGSRIVGRLCQTPIAFGPAFHINALKPWPPAGKINGDLTARMAVLPAVTHAPDGAIAVFADKQAAIFRDGDSDRATPDFAFGRDEAGHEVFIFAARFAR
jgi:hypothetical protein